MRRIAMLFVLLVLLSGCAYRLTMPSLVGLSRGGSQEIPRTAGLGVMVFEGGPDGNYGQMTLIPASRNPERGPVLVRCKKEWLGLEKFSDIKEIRVDFFLGSCSIVLQDGREIRVGQKGFEDRWGGLTQVVELWLVLPPGTYDFNYYTFGGRGPFKRACGKGRLGFSVSEDPARDVYGGTFVSWVSRIHGPRLEGR